MEIKFPPSKSLSRSFTLIELIVVIIIVGILAAMGITQYSKTVEKARFAEAKIIFGNVIKLAAAYRLENGSIVGMINNDVNIGSAADQIPEYPNCRSSYYFSYNTISSDPVLNLGYARCTAGGKTPQGADGGCQFSHNLVTGVTSMVSCWGDYVK